MTSTLRSISLLCALGGVALSAAAQTPGSWTLRAGAVQLRPQVDSGALSAPGTPGTRMDLRSASAVGGGLSYALTDRLVLDLPLSQPLRHDLVADGALAGVGKIGEVRLQPVSLLLQWRFGDAGASLRPYLGAGLTYAKFKARSNATLTAVTGGSPAEPTTLALDSRLGPTLQLGAAWAFDARWSLDAQLSRTWLKTKARLSTGQSIDLDLDPIGLGLAVGYRF